MVDVVEVIVDVVDNSMWRLVLSSDAGLWDLDAGGVDCECTVGALDHAEVVDAVQALSSSS